MNKNTIKDIVFLGIVMSLISCCSADNDKPNIDTSSVADPSTVSPKDTKPLNCEAQPFVFRSIILSPPGAEPLAMSGGWLQDYPGSNKKCDRVTFYHLKDGSQKYTLSFEEDINAYFVSDNYFALGKPNNGFEVRNILTGNLVLSHETLAHMKPHVALFSKYSWSILFQNEKIFIKSKYDDNYRFDLENKVLQKVDKMPAVSHYHDASMTENSGFESCDHLCKLPNGGAIWTTGNKSKLYFSTQPKGYAVLENTRYTTLHSLPNPDNLPPKKQREINSLQIRNSRDTFFNAEPLCHIQELKSPIATPFDSSFIVLHDDSLDSEATAAISRIDEAGNTQWTVNLGASLSHKRRKKNRKMVTRILGHNLILNWDRKVAMNINLKTGNISWEKRLKY